jgi:uncharacterized iron-regulated membrane protein
VSTLLLSQPLHFGDYGGMPLKIIWALLDLLTIVILITGLYLWYVRRRRCCRTPRSAAGADQARRRPPNNPRSDSTTGTASSAHDSASSQPSPISAESRPISETAPMTTGQRHIEGRLIGPLRWR